MSAPLSRADVLFRQRLLACSGLYHGALDGLLGPKTRQAEADADRLYFEARRDLGAFDPQTEAILAALQVPAQRPMRRLLTALSGQGWTVRAISGTRTYAEQAALYAQGRTAPGNVVTNAKAGQSNHHWGIAIDVGVFDVTGKYLKGETKADRQAYRDLGAIGRELDGIAWGGDFSTIEDNPHYELSTGLKIAEVRRRFEAGEPLIQP